MEVETEEEVMAVLMAAKKAEVVMEAATAEVGTAAEARAAEAMAAVAMVAAATAVEETVVVVMATEVMEEQLLGALQGGTRRGATEKVVHGTVGAVAGARAIQEELARARRLAEVKQRAGRAARHFGRARRAAHREALAAGVGGLEGAMELRHLLLKHAQRLLRSLRSAREVVRVAVRAARLAPDGRA